jgi:hypothetical protein
VKGLGLTDFLSPFPQFPEKTYDRLLISDKRSLMDGSDGFYRKPKRQRTLPLELNHDCGTPTTCSYIPSSWGARNGLLDEPVNTPHQPNLNTDLAGHIGPYCSVEPLSWSDVLDFGPSYPKSETFSQVIPVQSSEEETHASGVKSSMDYFADGSLFNVITETDSELNNGWFFDGISQEEVVAIEESNAKVIMKGHVHEPSKLPNPCIDDASTPLQFADNSLLNSEGDKIFQKRWEPVSQASGTFASESAGIVVHNEGSFQPGQSIDVL